MSGKAPVALTQKESELLTAVIQEMDSVPAVDFEKIKDKSGHKYARNARSAFLKVWAKLKDGTEGDASGNGDDGEAQAKPAKLAKPSPVKKGVGKTTTPRKASVAGAKKTPRKTKKGEPEKVEGESEGEAGLKKENSSEETEEVEGAEEVDGIGGKLQLLSNTHLRDDGFPEGTTDENIATEAEMIGLSVQEYRDKVKAASQH